MFLKRFYDDGLAQASYMIGCAVTGEAIVIDPNRDIEPYIEAAKAEKLRVTHVSETHIHADFVSGARELAKRTGAKLFLSAEGGKDWQYAFAKESDATLLKDGDVISIGNIRLKVMHTPGHTPESISFLVTDTAGASEPMGIVTGDFVFVGDVGRPDLLEKAAKVANTMDASARTLFHSLEKFRTLPDYLQVWPGHGAGSACGKALGAVPTSTVGYEKRFNWGVGTTDEATFVTMVLAGQPDPPAYFAHMKRVNRDGPAILGAFPSPAEGDLAALENSVAAKRMVIDIRANALYSKAHVPGTISLPLNKSFIAYAGKILPFDVDLELIGTKADVMKAARSLALIGFDRVTKFYDAAVVDAWRAAGHATDTMAATTSESLAEKLARAEVLVIDVRDRSELIAGSVPGALSIPLGEVMQRIGEIPRDKPIVLHCQGGGRSAIAASILDKAGIKNTANLTGGFTAWKQGKHPVVDAEVSAGK
jgi:hydroxyacylglutathione hydrolase